MAGVRHREETPADIASRSPGSTVRLTEILQIGLNAAERFIGPDFDLRFRARIATGRNRRSLLQFCGNLGDGPIRCRRSGRYSLAFSAVAFSNLRRFSHLAEAFMNEQKYDLIVIGTGPGGEGAAMQACKQGKNVAVIEKAVKIGGNCTHKGTIPSKALRFAIYRMTETNQNALFREAGVTANFSFAQLRRSAGAVISKQVDMRQTFYERNRVPVLAGTARFIDPFTIDGTAGVPSVSGLGKNEAQFLDENSPCNVVLTN